jgi:exodeoxyribonuclease VII small subunit
LRAHCEKKLRDAQLKVEKITQDAGGTVSTEPSDLS